MICMDRAQDSGHAGKQPPAVDIANVTGDFTTRQILSSERASNEDFANAVDQRIIKQNQGTVGFTQNAAHTAKKAEQEIINRQKSILKREKAEKEAVAQDLDHSKQVQFAEM